MQQPVTDSSEHDPYSALRYVDCRRFLIGYFVAVIGSQIQNTAVDWEIYSRTGKAMSLGWAGLVQALPVMLLSVPAGQLADVISRRRILIFSQVGAACCSLLLAWLSYSQGGVGWMYAILGLGSTFQAIGWPARSALLASTVPNEHFSNAATWNSMSYQTGTVLGPALAGLILIRSTIAAYLLNCIFAASFVVILLGLIEQPIVKKAAATSWETFSAGIQFVRKTRIILAIISLDLFAVLLGGATSLLPIFATKILHVGSVGFGWMRAAPAVGAVMMALIIAHLPPMKRAGRSLLLAVAAFGVATIVFGLSKSFWLSVAMLFLTGAFDAVSVVVRHTLVQVLTPDNMRGRVSAVSNIFIGASNELGGWESGLTAQYFGPIISVVGGGIGTLVVVIATALIWPEVRKFGSLKDAVPIPATPPPPAPDASSAEFAAQAIDEHE